MIDFQKSLCSGKQKAVEGKADPWGHGWMILDTGWRNMD
jgi:hypothetical protein